MNWPRVLIAKSRDATDGVRPSILTKEQPYETNFIASGLRSLRFHSRLPRFGIATRMEDGYDVNLIRGDFIKHSERKAPDNCASERPVNNRIQVRIENDSRQRVVDRGSSPTVREGVSEPGADR